MSLLGWAVVFLIIAIISAILGFGFLADISATLAKWIFIIFVILFIISLVRHLMRR